MRIVNYDYGYSNFFDCCIHGKIIVSNKEWKRIMAYVKRVKPDSSYPFYKNYVLKDWSNKRIKTKKGELVNLRVWATEKIVNRFNIERYKRGNYLFLITN